MAGRLKHMERSRRSHRKDANVFVQFNRNAYNMQLRKTNTKTVGQRLASILKGALGGI